MNKADMRRGKLLRRSLVMISLRHLSVQEAGSMGKE